MKHTYTKLVRQHILIVILLLYSSIVECTRSPHRPEQASLPYIVTYYNNTPQDRHILRDSHLQEHTFFRVYNHEYLKEHCLPENFIEAINVTQSVDCQQLRSDIDELVKEVMACRKEYTHFTILQNRDFNRKKKWGLLVVKSKKYPIVVKLFIEDPIGLVNPYRKGAVPTFFFFMGGGINRHLAGFTRIRNRDIVQEKINSNPRWQSKIKLPRKWFLMPSQSRWITIEGGNMSKDEILKTQIPSIYCIIADAIEPERMFSLSNPYDREIAMDICNDLGHIIDGNISNFMIEKKTGITYIIDTEHFPSNVGFKTAPIFSNYVEWYLQMINNAASSMFFRTKDERLNPSVTSDDISLNYNDFNQFFEQ